MAETQSIAKIQDTFDRWRQMGSRKLRSGTELIGLVPDQETELWLHVIHAGLPLAQIDQLERAMQTSLPRDLRALYRVTRGLSLFHGAFNLHGRRAPGFGTADCALQPEDILELNHGLDVLGWKPPGAVAFAANAWDQSVHLFGMTEQPRQVARCHRGTGEILELDGTIWECLVRKLYRLDRLITAP
ncbi:MAG: SMI1/KNR4 family protein [Planctomycetes bacterium]|nr:SMI1/KNR4 family protein [Planctomycetota bacterium]